MPLQFKTATPDDIPALIRLQTQIWEPTYRSILSPEQIEYMFEATYSPQSLARQLAEGHEFVLAREDAELVGFAALSEAGAATWKLQKLYVLPGGQGRGWGRQLVDEVQARVRQRGGLRLKLNVNRQNPAIGFYRKMGFAILREEDIPIGPYWMNDYVMEKAL